MPEYILPLPYFYNLKEKVGYTVRYIVRFNQEIDGEALRSAFESTMKRYPYLRLKLVKGLFSDHLEYNDAPLVVLETSEALTLCPETDDREPFMQKLPKRRRFGPGVSMPRAMKLSKMGLVKVSDPLVHCMRIDEKELMDWCKQHDATPNVAIAIMMNRAIHKLHPDSKLPIGASVSCDLRTTLNAPKSHWSLIFLLNLFYDKKIAKLDINDQCTVYRGSIIMQSDPDVLANATSVSKMFY